MTQPHSHHLGKVDCICKKESGQVPQSKEDIIIVNIYRIKVSSTEAKPSAKPKPKSNTYQ